MYSEALIEKVAWAMREASELTMSETRPLAIVALDALDLREVRAKAWDEGAHDAEEQLHPVNPYREEL